MSEQHARFEAEIPRAVKVELPSSSTAQQVAQAAFDIIPSSLQWEEYHEFGPGREELNRKFKPVLGEIHRVRAEAVRSMVSLARLFQKTGLNPQTPINEAMKIARKLPAENRGYPLSSIALAYVSIGNVDKAREISERRNPAARPGSVYIERNEINRAILEELARQGNFEEAVSMAEGITPRERLQAFTRLANIADQQGLPDQVLKIENLVEVYLKEELQFEQSSIGYYKTIALREIAAQQYLAGRKEQAKVTLHRGIEMIDIVLKKDDYISDYQTIIDYGVSCAKQGDISDAEIVRSWIDKYYKKTGIRMNEDESREEKTGFLRDIDLAIANRYATDGDFVKAEKIMTAYNSRAGDEQVAIARTNLLLLQGKKSDAFAEVMKLADDGLNKSKMLRTIAERFAEQGDVKTALEIVNTMFKSGSTGSQIDIVIAQAHMHVLGKNYGEALNLLKQLEIEGVGDAAQVSQELSVVARGMLQEK